MKHYVETAMKALFAGIFIGLGGAAYCLCDNKYIGALLFSVGLYGICLSQFSLITGIVGYAVNGVNWKDFLTLLTVFCFNFIGALLIAGFVRIADPSIIEKASAIVTSRMSQTPLQTIASGALCGMLVHFAVFNYKRTKSPLPIFIAVPAFILCGFEHCVADMFYFTAAEAFHLGHIGLVLSGNACGAMWLHIIYQELKF